MLSWNIGVLVLILFTFGDAAGDKKPIREPVGAVPMFFSRGSPRSLTAYNKRYNKRSAEKVSNTLVASNTGRVTGMKFTFPIASQVYTRRACINAWDYMVREGTADQKREGAEKLRQLAKLWNYRGAVKQPTGCTPLKSSSSSYNKWMGLGTFQDKQCVKGICGACTRCSVRDSIGRQGQHTESPNGGTRVDLGSSGTLSDLGRGTTSPQAVCTTYTCRTFLAANLLRNPLCWTAEYLDTFLRKNGPFQEYRKDGKISLFPTEDGTVTETTGTNMRPIELDENVKYHRRVVWALKVIHADGNTRWSADCDSHHIDRMTDTMVHYNKGYKEMLGWLKAKYGRNSAYCQVNVHGFRTNVLRNNVLRRELGLPSVRLQAVDPVADILNGRASRPRGPTSAAFLRKANKKFADLVGRLGLVFLG